MELSAAEKLIILMLCDLSKGIKAKYETDFKFVEAAIFDEQQWAIPYRYRHLGKFTLPPIVNKVFDFLTSWQFIEESMSKLEPAQLSKLKTDYYSTEFNGFDGNEESELFGIAQFIIHELNLYSIFKNRSLNSHQRRYHYYSKIHEEEMKCRDLLPNGYDYKTLDNIFKNAQYA